MYEEFLAILRDYEEVSLIDELGITSPEIVDRFEDKVENKFDELIQEETEET